MLYLCREISDYKGFPYEMAGYLDVDAHPADKDWRLGHMSLRANKDQMLGPKGTEIKGHESHKYMCSEENDDFTAHMGCDGKTYTCCFANSHLFAGFPHIYFYSNPDATFSFLKAAEGFR